MFIKILFLALLALTLQAASLDEIKVHFIALFKDTHQNIKISKLFLKTQGDEDIKNYTFLRFAKANLTRTKGFVRGVFSYKNSEKSVFFRYEVEAKASVLISSKAIRRNEVLNVGTYSYEDKNLANLPKDYLSEVKGSLIARRNIKRGVVLRTAYFKKKPVISKNDHVYGVLEDGQVSIMIELKALQSGFEGELIRLKNKEGKTLRGVVVNSMLVKIK